MNRKTITLAVGGVLAGGLLAAAPLAVAHHATANFDMTKQYVYKGAVKKWMWVNPHSWLYVEVRKGDGSIELWGFEGGAPNMLARDGWKASTMKPGDQVTVYGAPDRHGKRNAMLQKVILSSGKVLQHGGGPPPSEGPGAGPGGSPAGPGRPGSSAVEYK